jgi:hypothetical protein
MSRAHSGCISRGKVRKIGDAFRVAGIDRTQPKVMNVITYRLKPRG